MSIKIEFKGFEDLLNEIKDADGSIDSACESAIRQGAQTMREELKKEMQLSNVPNDLIAQMSPSEIDVEGNRFSARVGYKKGSYDPDNLSAGYKVLFLNYGTPNRRIHGKIKEGSTMKQGGTLRLGFIQRAKKSAAPKIRKAEKAALNKILERLRK